MMDTFFSHKILKVLQSGRAEFPSLCGAYFCWRIIFFLFSKIFTFTRKDIVQDFERFITGTYLTMDNILK
jgi:hypothetical protein